MLSPTLVLRAAKVGSCAPPSPVFPRHHGHFRDLCKVCCRNSIGRCPPVLSPDAVMLSSTCTALERCSPPIRARRRCKYMQWLSRCYKGCSPELRANGGGAANAARRSCEAAVMRRSMPELQRLLVGAAGG